MNAPARYLSSEAVNFARTIDLTRSQRLTLFITRAAPLFLFLGLWAIALVYLASFDAQPPESVKDAPLSSTIQKGREEGRAIRACKLSRIPMPTPGYKLDSAATR